MKIPISFILFILFDTFCQGQTLAPLTVEKIMRDPKWIGTSPSAVQWDKESTSIYFNWNPEKKLADSLYKFRLGSKSTDITKCTIEETIRFVGYDDLVYNNSKSAWVYAWNGDIYYQSTRNSYPKAITKTLENEANPRFTLDETAIAFIKNDNIYIWNIADGSTVQMTNIQKIAKPKGGLPDNIQDSWLKKDQLREFEILKERKSKRDLSDSMIAFRRKLLSKKSPAPIYIDDKIISGLQISPSGNFVTYRLITPAKNKTTLVPNYVTESGYTENIPARTKVGAPDGSQNVYIYNKLTDSILELKVNKLPGIQSIPDFYKEYPATLAKMQKDSASKAVSYSSFIFSDTDESGVLDIRSQDNKDRWLCTVDLTSGTVYVFDHQHDEAWIGGPGIGSRFGGGSQGWINDHEYYFQSEKTGYSHLYVHDFTAKATRALTQGNYEVQRAQLSSDKSSFYITTNQVHPGEQHFYHLTISDGTMIKITSMTGAHTIILSPDEKNIAYLYSYSNKPWELYIQDNKVNSSPIQITSRAMSDEFKSYAWRDPELISFNASDGARVYARLYKPNKKNTNKAAVIFVHGAGYLQNAHKWWSSYFREYMFHNLLADQGYTVLDMDYRGSAGYGRDWRTGIYRFMGGKDLSDHIDGASYLVKNHGVNASKIGIYGGSYGGFITLMGLFTSPNTFAAGAALRPVTDWAQYNHPYTSNILNEPSNDSIAYKKSSPFYHAAGLKNALLICHGMVDVNVHYQDAVKLTQRLIELGKNNWELASYPMEDHGFVEPSSWTDEYKRIFKLFNTWLK